MGTLNKFIRASVAGNCVMKAELHSFHMYYRATSHSSPQISPFESFTGRRMNIGFSDIPKAVEPVPVSARMVENNGASTRKMKKNADQKVIDQYPLLASAIMYWLDSLS